MTKQDLKAISDKIGLRIIRHPITSEFVCLTIDSEELIPELEELNTPGFHGVVGVERTLAAGTYTYRVYTPSAWFDLWGWTD